MSNILKPHGLQHTRPPYPTPGALLKLMSIESVMPSNHLILFCPLLLLPSIFSSIRVFPNESVLYIRWPKYWGFSFNISPSSEYSGLSSFRMDYVPALKNAIKNIVAFKSSLALIFFNHFGTLKAVGPLSLWTLLPLEKSPVV